MTGRAVIGLLVAVTSAAAAQSIEEQIRGEVTRYVAAVNRGDPQAVAALYLNDPRASTVGDGQIYSGWQEITEVLQNVYAELGTIQMSVDSVSVLRLGSTAAVAVMRYRWLLGSKEPQSSIGAMTLVYVQTRNGWRVAHDHTSTLEQPSTVSASTSAINQGGPSPPPTTMVECIVVRIVDGDTIECRRLGRVRLIGMDTPEMSQGPFGVEAAVALAALIPVGTPASLEQDVEPRDRYNRVLAYVWRDSVMVNWQLVRNGWAVLLTYPPNVRYVEWFTDAQRLAREENKGLWGRGGFNCIPVDRRRGRCD